MQETNWDDYRFILAVAECGTSLAAAERLGVNHTTVLRRITRFEDVHEIKVFSRSSKGYTPTFEGEAIIQTSRQFGEKITSLHQDIIGGAVKLEGRLSVTTTDTILTGVLGPHLASFRSAHPLIAVDLTVTNALLNITKRDADVGIRPSRRPPPDLVSRRVSGLSFAIYGAKTCLDHRDSLPLINHSWVGPGDTLQGAPSTAWISATIPDKQIALRVDSFTGMRDGVVAGIGLGLIPCCLGDGHPNLQRLSEPIRDLDTSLWILTRHDLTGSVRVRTFVDHIALALEADVPRLEGFR